MNENEKPFITSEELVESLLLVSEATKALAQEVMLIPKADEKGGVKEDGNNSNKTLEEVKE